MVDAPAELTFLLQIFVFFMGCCLGSFLNVVIYRLPLALSIVSPGSHCPQCKHSLAPYDNIPLLSVLILRGHCRYCGATISLRYPLIEALAGLLTVFLFRYYGWQAQFFIELLFTCSLLVIFFIDLDTMLIPDIISLPGIAIGLATSFHATTDVVGFPGGNPFGRRLLLPDCDWLSVVAGARRPGGR